MTANLLDYSPQGLVRFCEGLGEKPFRAKQLTRWVHQSGESDFSRMTDLAKAFREKLSGNAVVQPPRLLSDKTAGDATRKWLLEVGAGNAIETVFIPEGDCVGRSRGPACGDATPERDASASDVVAGIPSAGRFPFGGPAAGAPGRCRGTLCVSSQVGCALACQFCSTGRQGFNRDLTVAEIIGQLWWANKALGHDPKGERIISNVVLMGMGEPLLNFDNVVTALEIMLDDNAYGLSRRRVTVSTSGIVPAMDELRSRCPVALAVSLHAPNDALRDTLVPVNRKYPLGELMAACRRYVKDAPRDFITFEYVMLDGVNDTPAHARELIRLTRDVPCKFNLIPFNPFPDSGFARSAPEAIRRFQGVLMAEGIVATVRRTRGDDIDAACGQLAGRVAPRARKSQVRKTTEVAQ